MHLQELKLINFKNYEEQRFAFIPQINCFVGKNGVGKTNVLDAIYYLSFCKSYFNASDQQNIKYQKSFFSIHGFFHSATDSIQTVNCRLKLQQKKIIKCNDKTYERLYEHIGKFPVVMVSPYDHDLINGGSELRRKYFDSVISQFDLSYLSLLVQYNKIIAQCNFLLKKFAHDNTFNAEALKLWYEQLIPIGEKIYAQRKRFFHEFVPCFLKYYRFLGEDDERVDIHYRSQLSIENSFEEQLMASMPKDRIVKYVSVGTHKDDCLFTLRDIPLKQLGSQGQQKSFLIAIKLAQYEYTATKMSKKPMLLFDDIFDKLDEDRICKLMELVTGEGFGQIFIADTQYMRVAELCNTIGARHKIFTITNGVVQKEDLNEL